jgi:HK97 family phage prohead protease
LNAWVGSSFLEALTQAFLLLGPRRSRHMKDLLFKTFETEIKQEADSRRMTFKISSGAMDRDGDIIDPKGWQTDTYMTNPIVLFAHDYKSLPVARAISLSKTDTSLIATAEFPKKGVYPFADTVYDMVKGGFLNATSVGFKPLEYEPIEKGYHHTKQTLLEFSIVPVPANHEALVMQRAAGSEEAQAFHAPLMDWCEKFMETAKGKGQWVVGLDLSTFPTKQEMADFRKALTMFKAGMGGEGTSSTPASGDGMGGEDEGADSKPHLAGCSMKGKCPTPPDGHPDQCKMGEKCPMKAQNTSGGQASLDEEDVLAGIEFTAKEPVDAFVFDDETEHVLFGIEAKEITVTIRAAIRETLSEQIKQSVRSEVQYATGRLD